MSFCFQMRPNHHDPIPLIDASERLLICWLRYEKSADFLKVLAHPSL